MILSPRKNGRTSLFKEVRVFKGTEVKSVQSTESCLAGVQEVFGPRDKEPPNVRKDLLRPLLRILGQIS